MSQSPLGKASEKLRAGGLQKPPPSSEKKKLNSIQRLRKRWQFEQKRNALDEALLTKTHKGILRQISNMENKHLARMQETGVAPSQQYLNLLSNLRRVMVRQFNRLIRTARGIRETRNRLFKDLNPAETEARLEALLRIPQRELRHFDKLDSDAQETRLLTLMNQYGQGSKNAGFAEPLLLLPGYVSKTLIDAPKEDDGSNRRPQFIHEIIDRLIYAALHPHQYKTIFFHKTKNKVQRWNDKVRQIRGEGRLAMVKVMIVLLRYMDIKSLRIGHYEEGLFSGIRRNKLAEWANISLDSVKTALANLVEVGVLYRGKQPRDREKDAAGETLYKGLPVVRRLNPQVFDALGLDTRYQAESKGNRKELPPEVQQVIEQFEDIHADKSSSVKDRCIAASKLALVGA